MDHGFLGMYLQRGASKSVCFVVNVYYKSLLADELSMWDDLCMRKVTPIGEVWYVLGDFNSVYLLSERRGNDGFVNPSSNVDCVAFSSFISRMKLQDPLLLGKNFT